VTRVAEIVQASSGMSANRYQWDREGGGEDAARPIVVSGGAGLAVCPFGTMSHDGPQTPIGARGPQPAWRDPGVAADRAAVVKLDRPGSATR
jgi:hypothetical protein